MKRSDRSSLLSADLGAQGALATHYLHPGEIYASATPTVITTVLGSCVAVCLYHRSTRIGGMNHFVFPQTLPRQTRPYHVAADAIHGLIEQVLILSGASAQTLEAKLFGGSSLLGNEDAAVADPQSRLRVGSHNVSAARDLLARHKIPILKELVDQKHGLMLKMISSTGDVWVRPVNKVTVSPRQAPHKQDD